MKKTIALLLSFLLLLSVSAVFADGMKSIELSDGGSAEGEGFRFENSLLSITAPGDYLVTGTLSDGQISVDCAADGKVTLFLNGVSVHNADGPALLIGRCAPRMVVSLVDQTENALSNGTELVLPDGDEPDGVIFSRSDLTIEGSGSLTVTAGALNGIVSKDDFCLEGGSVTIQAVQHGIKGKDSVEISGGVLRIQAGRDGIKSTNKTESDRGYVDISGGDISIVCGDDAISYITGFTVTGGKISASPLKQ